GPAGGDLHGWDQGSEAAPVAVRFDVADQDAHADSTGPVARRRLQEGGLASAWRREQLHHEGSVAGPRGAEAVPGSPPLRQEVAIHGNALSRHVAFSTSSGSVGSTTSVPSCHFARWQVAQWSETQPLAYIPLSTYPGTSVPLFHTHHPLPLHLCAARTSARCAERVKVAMEDRHFKTSACSRTTSRRINPSPRSTSSRPPPHCGHRKGNRSTGNSWRQSWQRASTGVASSSTSASSSGPSARSIETALRSRSASTPASSPTSTRKLLSRPPPFSRRTRSSSSRSA